MTPTILTDREIRHRSDTKGVVITRVQTIQIGSEVYEASYWHQFETGRLVKVDSVPLRQ